MISVVFNGIPPLLQLIHIVVMSIFCIPPQSFQNTDLPPQPSSKLGLLFFPIYKRTQVENVPALHHSVHHHHAEGSTEH